MVRDKSQDSGFERSFGRGTLRVQRTRFVVKGYRPT